MFNSHRRSDIEIVHEILYLTRDGVRRTELLYQGNLSFTQLQNYLPYLVEEDLVQEKTVQTNGEPYRLYQLTSKGSEVLADIDRVISHFK